MRAPGGYVREATRDSRIYLPLGAFTALTGGGATVLEMQVPGSATRIEAAVQALRREFPEGTVAPVRELVEGESAASSTARMR